MNKFEKYLIVDWWWRGGVVAEDTFDRKLFGIKQ